MIVAELQHPYPTIARQAHPTMAAQRKRRTRKPDPEATESTASVALTVAWTVTITTLLFCNLAIVGAHYVSHWNPTADGLRLMKEMLLMAGGGLGVVSLVLLSVVYRVRVVAPPKGLAVFSGCLAAAPLLALLVRSVQ